MHIIYSLINMQAIRGEIKRGVSVSKVGPRNQLHQRPVSQRDAKRELGIQDGDEEEEEREEGRRRR